MTAPLLLLAQTDDASGELLGRVVDQLGQAGALLVQVLANLSKEGRPGHTVLVDVPADREEAVAAVLIGELGVWGYRVLQSDHRHAEIEKGEVDVELPEGHEPRRVAVRVKHIRLGGRRLRVKAEHDDLVLLAEHLGRDGRVVPLAALKSQVEAFALTDPSGVLTISALADLQL